MIMLTRSSERIFNSSRYTGKQFYVKLGVLYAAVLRASEAKAVLSSCKAGVFFCVIMSRASRAKTTEIISVFNPPINQRICVSMNPQAIGHLKQRIRRHIQKRIVYDFSYCRFDTIKKIFLLLCLYYYYPCTLRPGVEYAHRFPACRMRRLKRCPDGSTSTA